MDTEAMSNLPKLGPWPLGMVNTRNDYIPENGLIDATNVYIDKYGVVDNFYTPTRDVTLSKDTWRGWHVDINGNRVLFVERQTYPEVADDPYDKSELFIEMPGVIHWLAPLPTGMYIYAGDAVYWLDGPDIDSLRLNKVAGEACKGNESVAIISTEGVAAELTNGASLCAIWMTSVGFALGLPSGIVVYPQADRLIDIPLTEGTIRVFQDRVFFYIS